MAGEIALYGYDEVLNGFCGVDPNYGPVPLWWWDGEVIAPERLKWQMEKLAAGGLRNVCVINLAPTGPNVGSRASDPAFYSERWWELFEYAVRQAQRLGMFVWYYDQIGFSGANFPAQIVMAHPEFRGYHLGRWPRALMPENAEMVADDDEFVYATVRQGFNWLDPKACAVLLDRIHGEMERRLPEFLGTVILGSFQDELPPLPTWSSELLDRYQERFHHSLRPMLVNLFDDGQGAGAIRRRVWGLLGELAESAFFRPLGEWHNHHGLLIGCDQAGPGRAVDPHGAQRLYLDYPRTHRWFSAPGNDPDGEIKAHSSIAHVWGGKRVWLEAFHSSGWGATLEDTLHWLLPWYQAGATLYNPHAIYYSTQGGWWEWAAPDTGWRQPYWEHYQIFADLIARLSYTLSAGRHVADIAVYYPSHPLWESMRWPSDPQKNHPMTLAWHDEDVRSEKIRAAFWNLVGRQDRNHPQMGALRTLGRDFDEVDDLALQNAQVQDGKLAIGQERYQILIMPGTEALDETTRQVVEAFRAAGGWVLGWDVDPNEQRMSGIDRVDTVEGLARFLHDRVPRRVAGPGLTLQRQLDDGTEIFLLLPPLDRLASMHEVAPIQRRPDSEIFHYWIRGEGIPECWDPVTGTVRSVDWDREGDGVRITADFQQWPAMLVVLRHESSSSQSLASPSSYLQARAWGDLPKTEVPDRILDDEWIVRVEPTLDNQYGDFDRHHRSDRAEVEVRRIEVRVESTHGEGLEQHWYQNPSDETTWASRLWSETGAWLVNETDNSTKRPLVYSTVFGDMEYRTWAGRMGRVPRTFLNFGEVSPGDQRWATSYVYSPEAADYWLQCEGVAVKTVRVADQTVLQDYDEYCAVIVVSLAAGWNEVAIGIRAVEAGILRIGVAISSDCPDAVPVWIQPLRESSSRQLTQSIIVDELVTEALVHFVTMDGACRLSVDDQAILTLGDFMPYSQWGQQTLDLARWLDPGEHTIRLDFDDHPAGRALLDGGWNGVSGVTHPIITTTQWRDGENHPAISAMQSTDQQWIVPRRHLLGGVTWLERSGGPDVEPLTFVADPTRVGQAVWLRFSLPVGTDGLRLGLKGTVTHAWIDGSPIPIFQEEWAIEPGPAERLLVVRIQPEGLSTEAAVLTAPVLVHTVPYRGRLGHWREALHLPTFSGVVEYQTTVTGPVAQTVLDLGEVRGTAEVWVDEVQAGVRLWHPYRFDCPSLSTSGAHRLKIRVTNTLGAYYADGKPTSLCPSAQTVGGLVGPVVLSRTARPSADRGGSCASDGVER